MFDGLFVPLCAACGDPGRRFCAACADAVAPRAIHPPPAGCAGAFVVAPYRSRIGEAVARAKVNGERETFRELGRALGYAAHDLVAGDWFDAVVPAPSPWTRRLRRGFSPAHLLADGVAAAACRPSADRLSVRPGRRQSTLDAAARHRNLAGRVRCAPVRGRVLLVDDVVTTGATVEACAEALLRAGAASVHVLALCGAGRHDR